MQQMATLPFRSSSQPLVPTTPASRRKVKKGTFCSPNSVQLGKESAQELSLKPVPHSASKFQLLALVETHKQRTKMLPSPFGFGISADDEFLLFIRRHSVQLGS
jgi:hypothetical protein